MPTTVPRTPIYSIAAAPTSSTSPKDPSHCDGSRGLRTRDGRPVGAGLGAGFVRPPRSNALGVRHGAVLLLTAWRRAAACREWSPSRFLLSRQACLLAAYPPPWANVPQEIWMSTARYEGRVGCQSACRIAVSSSERLLPVECVDGVVALASLHVGCPCVAAWQRRVNEGGSIPAGTSDVSASLRLPAHRFLARGPPVIVDPL